MEMAVQAQSYHPNPETDSLGTHLGQTLGCHQPELQRSGREGVRQVRVGKTGPWELPYLRERIASLCPRPSGHMKRAVLVEDEPACCAQEFQHSLGCRQRARDRPAGQLSGSVPYLTPSAWPGSSSVRAFCLEVLPREFLACFFSSFRPLRKRSFIKRSSLTSVSKGSPRPCILVFLISFISPAMS